MTEETLASTDATTPDEAPVPYEPIGETVEGTAHVETVSDEPEVGDSEHYVESPQVEKNDQSFWDTQAIRPPFILSFVESDHPSGGFVIGWDTCGDCLLHLRSCTCKNGPAQPKYVKNWRPAADKNHDKAQAVTPAVRKAVVAADPQVVEKAVDAVLSDSNDKSRKRRADAGVKRGPRKDPNATPDSVAQAAGSLADAMSKE